MIIENVDDWCNECFESNTVLNRLVQFNIIRR